MVKIKTILYIALMAGVFAMLMGYRQNLPVDWMRAAVAALAFMILGYAVSYVIARRSRP